MNTGKQLIAHLVYREALSGIGLIRFIYSKVSHEFSVTSTVLSFRGSTENYKSEKNHIFHAERCIS